MITQELREELELMLNELDSSCLEVCLVPQRHFTNHGGMVRVALSKNATWYRQFCGRFGSSRRRKNCLHDTRIKRRNTLAALRALIDGRITSGYSPVLLGIAKDRINQPAPLRAFGGVR